MGSSIGQRLGFFLKCNRISQGDFAKTLGTSRTSISALISGSRPLSHGMLARIIGNYPSINKDWLLTGEGKMEKPSKDMRPHYPATVSAGFLGNINAVNEEDIEMMPRIAQIKRDYDFTIMVEGDSMEPVFFNGDTLACRKLDRGDELKSGLTYVVDTKDGAVVKTLLSETNSSIRLHSENAAYRNFNIAKSDILGVAEVVGSVPADPQAAKDAFYKAYLDLAASVINGRVNTRNISPEELVRQVFQR